MKYTPIFYMGNKTSLIERGLIDMFPKEIDTFYDLFCGSGAVSINVQANKKVLNDINIYILSLIELFINYSNNPDELVVEIDNLIDKFNLPKDSSDIRKLSVDDTFKEDCSNSYNKLRDYYNYDSDKNPILLYILTIFSYCHLIRYNQSGNFNMPFGKGYYNDITRQLVKSNPYTGLYKLTNVDYITYVDNKFSSNDFIYLDPPYLGTNAVYNDSCRFASGWCQQDDFELFEFCDKLNDKGIKFGLSNVYSNKNFVNTELIRWVDSKGYNVHHFDNFTYSSCGKGNANSDEVFICNYKPYSRITKKSLF